MLACRNGNPQMSIALRIRHRKQRAKSAPYILGLKTEVFRRNWIKPGRYRV
jgi:hypothetical protein